MSAKIWSITELTHNKKPKDALNVNISAPLGQLPWKLFTSLLFLFFRLPSEHRVNQFCFPLFQFVFCSCPRTGLSIHSTHINVVFGHISSHVLKASCVLSNLLCRNKSMLINTDKEVIIPILQMRKMKLSRNQI